MLPSAGGSTGQSGKQAAVSEVLKPFLLYLQCLWVVATLHGVEWPTTLSGPLQALTWFFSASTPQTLGIECVMNTTSKVPITVQVFLISMLMPVAIIVVVVAIEALRAVFRSRRRGAVGGWSAQLAADQHVLIAHSIIVVCTFLPQLMRAAFSFFACVVVDSPVNPPYQVNAVGTFWASDMSQHCWQGYHSVLAFVAGLPMVVLLCAVLPSCMVMFLARNRNVLYTAALRPYAFMYEMYKPSVFYWEAVIVVQLAVVVAIAVFSHSLGTYYGCILLTAALALSAVLTAWVRPHASTVARHNAVRGSACVFFTKFSALSFLPSGIVSAQIGAGYAVAERVIACINLGYVASVMWHILHALDWQWVQRMATSVATKLRAVFKK
jgi:hypothetical protein